MDRWAKRAHGAGEALAAHLGHLVAVGPAYRWSSGSVAYLCWK